MARLPVEIFNILIKDTTDISTSYLVPGFYTEPRDFAVGPVDLDLIGRLSASPGILLIST